LTHLVKGRVILKLKTELIRGTRRLYQRNVLRRERLNRVLNVLGFLPEHYAAAIDFENRLGQFKNGIECKINYRKNDKGKYEFLFKNSFEEMVKEFAGRDKQLKIPYDWTIYYLRKKALAEKISKEELAWVILNFNQKRGYYQLRGEEENEDDFKIKEYCVLTVDELIDSGEEVKGNKLYDVIFTNGWKYDRQIIKTEDWLNKTKEFIVTTTLEKDGISIKKDKDGNDKRSFKAVDSEKDWIAIKKKTEQDIEKSEKTVGQFIYETILNIPSQKVRGKLVRTVERKFYKEELEKILKTQIKFHPELSDKEFLALCVEELYPRNEAHQNFLKEKDFVHLFVEDIIFYQRPLKSKKSGISNCQYEYRVFKNEKGERQKEYLKAIPKSHPLFQEFRLWQFLKNLKIYQKSCEIDGKTVIDVDVTIRFLPDEEAWVELFDFLSSRKEVEQKQLLDYFVKSKLISKGEKENFRWNYVEDKKYPCSDTKAQFISRFKKVDGVELEHFLTKEIEKGLWHIIYSISDKKEYEKALGTFARKHEIDEESFVESFKKFPPFKSEYGAYSEKAIKKLLPLMRRGIYWNKADVPEEVRLRIDDIIKRLKAINFDKKRIDDYVADDDIPKQLLKSFTAFQHKNPYQGLNTYQACYAVYNRHSEVSSIAKWKSPEDIENFLQAFKQHSLRNPIVEQVVTETLRVVHGIWKYYGKGAEDFFNEIHVELGRELKNPANKREEMSRRNIENENTNQRIRQLLVELKNDGQVEGDIRPYSPSHQEILKIYEEGIYQNPDAEFSNLSPEDVDKIRRNANPTKSEIIKYKLWLEQGYVSPYTGQPIQLSRLFTTDYQIEHIIPQSRYFDDSLSNKVICESAINPGPYKDNQTGYEFIKNNSGRIIPELSTGNKTVRLFTLEEYENHCNKYFSKNRTKLKKLLSEDIPEGFIQRQMNDSRYISKLVKGLLSNIVRQENEVEATSKFMLPVSGSITSKLKEDWGLNDRWNEIIAQRFMRLNELTTSSNFGYWDNRINAFRSTVPDEISRGFSKKRIDHRHHALDALVIACVSRKHTHYLNALNAENKNYALRDTLLVRNKHGDFTRHFKLPWDGFPLQAQRALETTVVSFKQNQRIINKANNKTWQWVEKHGSRKKELVKQTKGDNWAIRKPMHKDTVSGAVNVRLKKRVSFANGLKDWKNLVDKDLKNKIRQLLNEGKNTKAIARYFKENPYPSKDEKVTKVEVYCFTIGATAARTSFSEKFTRKQLKSVTDSGIRKILENHLRSFIDEKGKERFDLAFNPDGLDELNKNIVALNGGKFHHPIYKVMVYEEGKKFNVGDTGSKNRKFVEAAKGTNLFFAIYWNEDNQKREYETIPLNRVILHQKWRATLLKDEQKSTPMIPVNQEKGKFLFSLSPNDLVYVPTEDEMENPKAVDFDNVSKNQTSRIYKMVSSTGNQCFFVQCHVAQSIYNKVEFSTLNKMEKSLGDEMIKEKCWKLEVDRLGNITKVVW